MNAGLPPELNADGFGIGWYSSPDAGSDTGGHGDAPEGLRGDAHEPGETVLSLGPGWSGGDSTGYDVRRLSVAERLPSRSVARRRVVNMPGVFTSITPAWNNTNLRTLSAKIRSSMVFAHVRAAALGAIVSDQVSGARAGVRAPASDSAARAVAQNCHPFTFGRWLFMHNGMVSGFGRVRRRLLQALPDELFGTIRGNTDSEHWFAAACCSCVGRALTGRPPRPAGVRCCTPQLRPLPLQAGGARLAARRRHGGGHCGGCGGRNAALWPDGVAPPLARRARCAPPWTS